MIHTARAFRGMVSAPHHLAAEAGLRVLREGGNAVEAMLSQAATVAVVYPHMNSIGGDGFWLIKRPRAAPVAIDACGGAGRGVDAELYASKGLRSVPSRGPLAANTVAGTVGGWRKAFEVAAEAGGSLRLERLLEDAIHYAEHGVPVTASQHRFTTEKLAELRDCPGFAQTYLDAGVPYRTGARFRQPRLADTLKCMAREGLEGFYRGELARRIGADLARAGCPVAHTDLQAYQASLVAPLSIDLSAATLYNLPPPTQGLASLLILGLFDRSSAVEAETCAYVHALVESTKQAFIVRDREITDPAYMRVPASVLLAEQRLHELLDNIHPQRALPWPAAESAGDTIWMGAIDANGLAVSFIQSIYWEFGSGVVLDETGLLWQNRGSSFKLERGARNALRPGRKPFHTLNPALATLNDGRVMVYGTMGGEGQPQTQAALYTRYAVFGQSLQTAITAPRWLLGRTWGAESTTLKLENRFDPALIGQLADAGHEVETVAAFSDSMGHAGAVVRHRDGLLEGAADPRSDGQARGF